MGRKSRGILLVSLIFVFGISLPAQTKQSTRNVVPLGMGFLSQPFSSAVGTEDWSKASSLRTKSDLELVKPLFSSRFQAATAPLAVPSPFSRPISGTISGVSGFNGLDHADSRLASNGEQFSAEPPDQALGVSRTQVLEAVNDVVALYSRSGSILAGPTALNAFFGLAPEVVNSNPPKYGPFLTDPKIQYDDRTSRWFLTVLEIAVDSATGNFKNDSKVLIAVSRNSDPRNGFNLFSIDVTDSGFIAQASIFTQARQFAEHFIQSG